MTTIFEAYPNNPQSAFVKCPVGEIFFGGARGGAKTYGLILKWVHHAATYKEHANGLIIRRQYTQLKEVIEVCRKILGPLGGKYSSGNKLWTFPKGPLKGALLHLAHLWNESDAENFQGWSLTFLGIEEVTNWPNPEPLLRLYASTRSGKGVKTQVCLTGNPGGPGHCIRYGEVLTPDGWKDIKHFRIGDPVYTVTKTGEMIASRVDQVHSSLYRGDVIEANARGFHLSCTPNHSVAVPGVNLVPFEKLPGQATVLRSVSWTGNSPSVFTIPEIHIDRKRNFQPLSLPINLFLELLGWFLSEGHTVERDNLFCIAQTKENNKDRITHLLDDCGFKWTWNGATANVYSVDWFSYFKQFGRQHRRFIPTWVKNCSTDLLRILFDSLMSGDGHWRKDGGYYYTTSRELADDFSEISLKLGYIVYQRSRDRGDHWNTSYEVSFKRTKSGGTELLTGHHVYDVKTTTKRKSDIQRISFFGMVYCLGINDTHTFIVRQNGCVWISGNSWVKERFIDPSPSGWTVITDPATELQRIFIPSYLEDNLELIENDPAYEARLRMLGNPELVKAWRYGIWDINIRSYFADVWNPHIQIIEPFKVPPRWQLGRSFDWGHAAPASLGMWAISDGNPLSDGRWFPKGSMIRVNEKYYALRDANGKVISNTGVKMRNRDLGQDVARVTGDVSLDLSVADPSIWAGAPGESIHDQMIVEAPTLWFSPPLSKDRISGWMLMRDLLGESSKERPEAPGMWVTTDCTDGFIRTIPNVMMDEKNPDDIDTDGEDHAMDEARYMTVTVHSGQLEKVRSRWG